MANIAITSDAWTEISITGGTVQNISATADIELSAEQTDNSGVVLKPSEIYQWDNETIYARAVTEAQGALRVVNFKKAAGGGGSYVLPVATASKLGGVKVGNNLTIDESGVLSATGGASLFVGHIDWQMIVMPDYLKLDGDTLNDASTDYADLLSFAQTNNLITADSTNKALFQYDSDTDILTLPDYIGLCLQGGNGVEAKAASLPNIKGTLAEWGGRSSFEQNNTTGAFEVPTDADYPHLIPQLGETNTSVTAGTIASFDASRSSVIYNDNTNTVQPPAITLIPQIKYK